jgi:hypothetical protein
MLKYIYIQTVHLGSFRKCGNRIDGRTESSMEYEPKNLQLCDTFTRGRDLKTRLLALISLNVTFIISLSLSFHVFVVDLILLYHNITIKDAMKPSDYRCLRIYISINIQQRIDQWCCLNPHLILRFRIRVGGSDAMLFVVILRPFSKIPGYGHKSGTTIASFRNLLVYIP